MSPLPNSTVTMATAMAATKRIQRPSDPDGLVLEAWAQGYMVGSLIIMACITIANMRKGVLLHKIILLELLLGIWHGFWMFFDSPIYEWWLSISAIFLNISWSLHNLIAWMKIKPFLPRPVSYLFIGTVILVQPYWVVEIYANFAYFHNINKVFLRTRPWEPLCRDPWWIWTTVALFYNITVRYEMKLFEIIRISPRFGIMLGAMLLSIVFIVLDVLSVTGALQSGLPVGLNPFWKLSFVFKCLTDSVILDDFKTALDRLRAFKISRLGSFAQDNSDRRTRDDGNLVNTWEELAAEAHARGRSFPSPDGDRGPFRFPGFKPRPKSPSKEHKEHKDSLVAPTEPLRKTSNDLAKSQGIDETDFGDMEIRKMESARLSAERYDMQPQDVEHLAEEREYYRALREMSDVSPPTSPTHTRHSR